MLDLEMSVLIEVKKSVEFVPWGDVRVLALRISKVIFSMRSCLSLSALNSSRKGMMRVRVGLEEKDGESES